MAATLRHFAVDAPQIDIAKGLGEDGAVVVDALLDADTLARVNDELEAYVDAADPERSHLNPAIAGFFGTKTRHVAALASKSRTFATDVMCHPLMLAICDELLLPSCAEYVLNLGHVIDRGPGAEAQLTHRDEAVWVHVPRPAPILQVASMIALGDFTADNGATRIVPGSHLWEDPFRQPEPDEFAEAVMPAGSAVIYLGWTIHGAGANRTADVWRRGLHMSYLVGWLRTEENNVLATPPELARGLPRRAQALLGYGVHDAIRDMGGYAGMVELSNPLDLLAEGKL
jgi:ectoine hydroxylase-related dioxygenase (phytanoyl-CoA dioxygenase family)